MKSNDGMAASSNTIGGLSSVIILDKNFYTVKTYAKTIFLLKIGWNVIKPTIRHLLLH